MAGADHPHLVLRPRHDAQQRLGQHLDRRRRRLLHENVAVAAMLEGIQDQVHRIVQRHHEARHRPDR